MSEVPPSVSEFILPNTKAQLQGHLAHFFKRSKAAWEKCGSKRQLWDDVRALFRSLVLSSLSSLYAALALGFVKGRLELENTS